MRKSLVISPVLLTIAAAAVGHINQVQAARTKETFPLPPFQIQVKTVPTASAPSLPTYFLYFTPEQCEDIRKMGVISGVRSQWKMSLPHLQGWVECRLDMK
jgi:hypothetical protein